MANVTSPPDADTTFDRLPTEPVKAWRSFVLYREMGYDRTMDAVRKELGKNEGYLSTLEQWSMRWRWVQRARLFDDHIERAARREAERSIPLWEERRQESLRKNLELSARLRERVEMMLSHPITKEVVKHHHSGNLTYVIPSNWTWGSIAGMVRTIAELEAATIAEGLLDEENEKFDASTATLGECRAYIEGQRNRAKGPGTSS